MTHNQFVKLAGNFSEYARSEVTYRSFSPSANKIVRGTGILLGIGIENDFCHTVIIGEGGHRVQVYYTYVNFPKKQTLTMQG